MSLIDLLIPERIAPAEPGAKSMSLPQAMNLLERGLIAEPTEMGSELGSLMMPQPLPPAPKQDPLSDIAAEQAAQNRADRDEMLIRVRARRLQNSAADFNERQAIDERLHDIERQLKEDYYE